jgi:hypothetical protein
MQPLNVNAQFLTELLNALLVQRHSQVGFYVVEPNCRVDWDIVLFNIERLLPLLTLVGRRMGPGDLLSVFIVVVG